MVGVDIFISCGAEVERYREIGHNALVQIEHMFRYELDVPLAIGNWDFRRDAPRIVVPGGLATRSLSMVERTNAMIAIFGAALPQITCQEIRKAFRLRQAGNPVEVWLFLSQQLRSRRHTDFLARIRRDFGQQVVFAQYGDELEFQAKLFTSVIPFLLTRFRQAAVPIGDPS